MDDRVIIIKVHGGIVETMTPKQFRSSMGRVSDNYLPDLVEQYNNQKKASGEPARASIEHVN